MALSKIDVANMLTGTAPVANGGTGVTSADEIGNLVKLSSASANNDATLSFDSSLITDTYEVYKLIYRNVRPTVDAAGGLIEFSSDNGSSYISSGYYRNVMYAFSTNSNDSTVFYKTNQADSTMKFGGVSGGLGGLSRAQASGHIDFYNFRNNTNGKAMNIFSTYESSGGGSGMNFGTYYFDDASVINNLRIKMNSGNISIGEFALYGVKT
jgi:hypothetical protein